MIKIAYMALASLLCGFTSIAPDKLEIRISKEASQATNIVEADYPNYRLSEAISHPSIFAQPGNSGTTGNTNQRTNLVYSLLVTALSVTINVLLTALLTAALKTASTYRHKLSAKTEPASVEHDETINSVMIVGIGGVGKTSLINALTNDSRANSEVKTATYEIYSISLQMPADSPKRKCRLYLSDYSGQDIDSFIRGFIEQQHEDFSPMRYGYVHSLILVVDIFEPSERSYERVPCQDSYSNSRVQKNLEMWNEQATLAIFGMLTDSLKYVCLFINKIDLLEPRQESDLNLMKQLYYPIYQYLERRSRGVKLQVLVGSFETGESVQQLRDDLIRYSVSPQSSRST
jgi:GTPase SAR1 family protein